MKHLHAARAGVQMMALFKLSGYGCLGAQRTAVAILGVQRQRIDPVSLHGLSKFAFLFERAVDPHQAKALGGGDR